jgi:anti-sigma B factor antagonist
MPPFTVESRSEPDTIRVVVQGELDIETGPRLREELDGAHAAAPAVLVLDLRGVTFFDSTGLQIVLDADVRSRAEERRFVVLVGEGEPRRVLELADVTDRLSLREPEPS